MPSFSERQGFEPPQLAQVGSMDRSLRVGLWNVPAVHIFEDDTSYIKSGSLQARLTFALWHHFFREPVDEAPATWSGVIQAVRDYYFEAPWNKAYDLVQFMVDHAASPALKESLQASCNAVLKRDAVGYRFIEGILVPVVSDEEIEEVGRAAAVGGPLAPVSAHLRTALRFLGDRDAPDYRNAVKEAISAVEAVCKLVAGEQRGDLQTALSKLALRTNVAVHNSLRNAFNQLYSYSSDAEGIRHALMDEPQLDVEDARFMLVACAAFVNYMVVKASKAGLPVVIPPTSPSE